MGNGEKKTDVFLKNMVLKLQPFLNNETTHQWSQPDWKNAGGARAAGSVAQQVSPAAIIVETK